MMAIFRLFVRMTAATSWILAFLAGPVCSATIILTIPPRLEPMVQVAEPDSPTHETIRLAQGLIAKKDLKAAREELQKLANSPGVVHSEVLLAELLMAAGFAGDARAVLEELSVQDPVRQDVYVGFCELAVRERRWFDGWNLANVGERAVPQKEWSPEFRQQVLERFRLLKAVCCEGRRDWKAAQATYNAMTQKQQTSRDVLAGLGRTSFHLGEIEAAIRHFTSLKKLDATTDPPHLMLAQLYDQTDKVAEAEAAYRQAVDSAELADKVRVRLSFARWLIVNNRPRDTAKLLEDEIKDSQENETERQFLQALAARMEGRLADARKLLSSLHQQNPSKFVISNQLALVLCQSDDESLRARSLQIAEANTRNLPESSESWATLGWVQFQLGDRGTAEKSLLKATQLGSLSRDALYYLCQLKRAAGDLRAVEMLDKAFREAKGPNYFAQQVPAKPQ